MLLTSKSFSLHSLRAGAGFKAEFSFRGDRRHWPLLRRIVIWVWSVLVEADVLFAASFPAAFVEVIFYRRVFLAE